MEQVIKLPRYTIGFKQLAKDGKWIAEEVKVRADTEAGLDEFIGDALKLVKENLAELNKGK